MKIKNIITATALFLASTSSFAFQMFHPVTGDLILDTDEAEFSSTCTNNELSANDDGSLDLVYLGFNAIGGAPSFDTTCMFKIPVHVPGGWKVVVSTEAAVGGNYIAPALASFSHTLAGSTVQADFKYFPSGADSYTLRQSLTDIGYSVCSKDIGLKTVANIVALDTGSFVNINSGSIDGKTVAWRYFFDWYPC